MAQNIIKICSIDECGRSHYARGLCRRHYSRWFNNDPNRAKCRIVGCEKNITSKGLCKNHYERLMKYGDPLGGQPPRFKSPEEGFAARTERQGDCLVWVGGKVGKYGHMRNGEKVVRVHRYAWERENGPIPGDMEIDHICHNTLCVNTDHLRLATRDQNASNLSGPHATNKTSGIRNVYWHTSNEKWAVKVKRQHLGCYDSLEEAAAVAEQARKDLFGDYAGRG